MNVIKRNGSEVKFDSFKISNAVQCANSEVDVEFKLSDSEVQYVVNSVERYCHSFNRAVTVEEIQDKVEDCIMSLKKFNVARKYITYRYEQSLKRRKNTTDDKILSLIECDNEEVKQENSNKNPTVNSVQRDYMAGEVSKDITMRKLLPDDVVKAHNEGIIHFHDSDYFAQHMHNCCLVNLEDMLQNGTVISGTMIEKPHSFSTACNIATQIIAQIASNQYGGQSISLTHLAPFVDVSRQKIKKQVATEFKKLDVHVSEDKLSSIVEERLRDEIRRGVQTIQYQVVTLMTTNGQAPFVTVYMYLNEARSEQEKNDLAIIIEETLRQRYKGVKNEQGVWVTPAFPKLIYVLDEDNTYEDYPYFYLTQLAAKCTAKRMVPDYISAKKMRELKLSKGENPGEGDVYTCMGCLDYHEKVTLDKGTVEIGELADKVASLHVPFVDNGRSIVYDVTSLDINIMSSGYLDKLRGVIVNRDVSDWIKVVYRVNGYTDIREVTATYDHPFVVEDGTVKEAQYLTRYDMLLTPYDELAHIVDIKIVSQCCNSYDVTTESGYFDINDSIYSHNCRSFLTPDRSGNGFDNVARAKNYEHNKPKYYGRFNQGVVTINLPDVALSSHKDFDKFWSIFDERLELCHKALRCRHERLKGTLSDAAPILWQHGALARLEKGETIDKLLYGGYSTISLGYAGLYECVKYMTDKSHTDKEASPFALSVMQYMNDKCSRWKAEEDVDYSLYGTPIESTTYKFAKCLQDRFGVVPGVTDKGYITNSYHVHVSEKVDAFTKLKFESKFQALSPGGAISYVEVPNMQDNLQAVIRVMQFIYENIMYAELNTKSDYCQTCGYDGEIRLVEDDGKLVWECPCCGERDTSKLNVARRTCGYIGTQFWNQGRTEEIRDRVLHL